MRPTEEIGSGTDRRNVGPSKDPQLTNVRLHQGIKVIEDNADGTLECYPGSKSDEYVRPYKCACAGVGSVQNLRRAIRSRPLLSKDSMLRQKSEKRKRLVGQGVSSAMFNAKFV